MITAISSPHTMFYPLKRYRCEQCHYHWNICQGLFFDYRINLKFQTKKINIQNQENSIKRIIKNASFIINDQL